MANITHGMNVDVINGQIVPGLNQQAQAIDQVISAVDRLNQQVQENWKGNDANQFQQKWTGEYRTKLNQLAQELRQLATTARNNASNQTSTSATL